MGFEKLSISPQEHSALAFIRPNIILKLILTFLPQKRLPLLVSLFSNSAYMKCYCESLCQLQPFEVDIKSNYSIGKKNH